MKTPEMTGIADEAAADLEGQIEAHRELGWSWIELRNIGGRPVHDLPEAEIRQAATTLERAGMGVACLASTLGNWASRITRPLEEDRATLERVVSACQRFGCRRARVMSWPNDGLDEREWRDRAVERMRDMAERAERAGLVLALENCGGWAGQSPENYAEFLDRVDHPGLRALYDTGNPVVHGDADPWPWYLAAKPRLEHIHVKDHSGPGPNGEAGRYTLAGDGRARVAEVLRDALAGGYAGFVSIEPHLDAVVHEGRSVPPDAAAARRHYLAYGRRTVEIKRRAAGFPL